MRKAIVFTGVLVCLLGFVQVADATSSYEACFRDYQRLLSISDVCQEQQRDVYAAMLASAATGSLQVDHYLAALSGGPSVGPCLKTSDTSYTWSGSSWVGEFRSTYQYDGNSRVTDEVTQEWSGSQWVNYTKHVYTYDGTGQLATNTLLEWESNQWVNQSRTTYTYYKTGLYDEMLVEIWQGGAWVNQLRTTIDYTDDLAVTATTETWQGGTWVNSSRTSFQYDAGDNNTELLIQSWSGGSWVNLTRVLSTWDGSGNLIQALTQLWQDEDWMNTTKTDYTYDGLDRNILSVQSSWAGALWMEMEADTCKWDGELLIEEVSYQILMGNLSRWQYSYDGNGCKTLALKHAWSGSSWVNEKRHVYVYGQGLAAGDDLEPLPRSFALEQNYPNPFNPTTTIRYRISRPHEVEISIYNLLGQQLVTLESGYRTPGIYETTWDGTDSRGRSVASGFYLYRITAGDYSETRKMLLLK